MFFFRAMSSVLTFDGESELRLLGSPWTCSSQPHRQPLAVPHFHPHQKFPIRKLWWVCQLRLYTRIGFGFILHICQINLGVGLVMETLCVETRRAYCSGRGQDIRRLVGRQISMKAKTVWSIFSPHRRNCCHTTSNHSFKNGSFLLLQKENMELQIYDSVVRGGVVSPYCHTVAVFPHDQQRSSSIWPTSPQTGSDGGGIFSNESDFKSFTYLFICPSGSSAFARRQRDRIFFFFILGLAWTTLSINIRTVGGREASWAAGRQMVLESVSDARQLLRIPAHTGTDTEMHATRYLQKSAGLT